MGWCDRAWGAVDEGRHNQGGRVPTLRVSLQAGECQEPSVMGEALALFLGNLQEGVPVWSA